MTLDAFAQWAAAISKPDQASRMERLTYVGLGLIGEAGEVADILRRGMRDGTLNEDQLVYELADLLFHWVLLCAELGQSPETVVARSRAIIEERVARQTVTAPARFDREENRA
jgi:NTP pyrophosphatase (non-canonical NTP hydrolase)